MDAWVPAGFHDNLNSAQIRFVVQRLMDNGTPAPTWTTNSPVKPITSSSYKSSLNIWFKSAGLTEDEILALNHDERCGLVETFLAKRSSTVTDNTLNIHRFAIGWWAGEHNIASPVTDVAKAIKGQGKGRGKADVLTSKELTALIAGLKKCEVATRESTNIDARVGWHLRTRAAILVTIACSLRINSELPHFKDENILKVDDEGIHLRIIETKTGVHRDVVIRPRSDELCPIRATEDFYKWLDKHNLRDSRPDGLLLPPVNMNRRVDSPGILHTNFDSQAWWGQRVVPYMESQGFDMTGKTLHGLRSMAITEAVNSGWSHTELRDLGGWQSLNTAAGYARNNGADIDLYGEGA